MAGWMIIGFRIMAVFFSALTVFDVLLRHLPLFGEPWSLIRVASLTAVYVGAIFMGLVFWEALDPLRRQKQ